MVGKVVFFNCESGTAPPPPPLPHGSPRSGIVPYRSVLFSLIENYQRRNWRFWETLFFSIVNLAPHRRRRRCGMTALGLGYFHIDRVCFRYLKIIKTVTGSVKSTSIVVYGCAF
jgi:hypothetical protein